MKKEDYVKYLYLMPLQIAFATLALYYFIYSPDIGTEDFTTALLVFLAALGAAAIVIFTGRKSFFIMYVYVALSLLFGGVILFVVKISPVNSPLHYITFALMFIGFVYLRLFVGAHRVGEDPTSPPGG